MDHYNLNKLLESYAKQPLPFAPENLTQNVWREIRLRRDMKHDHFKAFCVWFQNFWLEPQILFAALILACLIGFSMASFQQTNSKSLMVQGALELKVFSSFAEEMPSTLLAKKL